MSVIITMRHVRASKLCSAGLRDWCAQNGFDYSRFLKEGYPIEEVEATGDALALRVAAIARKEAKHG